jgi:O-antigen/teichoic acid export membrane protein
MVITSVGVAVNLALSTPSMVIIGHGRSDLLSKRALTLGLAIAAAQCIVAVSHGGVVGTCTVAAIGSVLTAWIGIVQQRRVWRPKSRPHGKRSEDIADILREGSANFTISVAGTVAFNSDTIILGAFAPLTAVAAYTLAAKLPSLIRVLSSRAIDLLQPTYSHLAASVDAASNERLFRVLTRSARFSIAVAVALGIGACTSGDLLLHVWLGGTPSKTGVVLVLLTIGIILQMFGHAIYVFLTGIRKLRHLLIYSLASAVANVALSIVFTKHLGAPGPAVGSMICVLIGDLFVLPSISASALGVRSVDLLKRLLTPPLLPLLPAVGVVFAFHVSTRSVWSLPVGAAGALVYLVGFWILVGEEDRRYAVETTRRVLRRSPQPGS